MKKKELKNNLIRRINHLIVVVDSNKKEDTNEKWNVYYNGYKKACKQILEMINEYE